jgi:spore germination protein GerM
MAHRTLAALIAALALALAGCGGSDEPSADTQPAPPPAPPATTAEEEPAESAPGGTVVRLYYLDGEKVASPALGLTEPVATVAADALRLLLKNEEARQTEIPAGTKLNGVSIVDGVATVDLSREFESGGGSASMQARVAQVVYTVTQWPNVRAVSFELDGEPVEAIGGEGVPAREVTRADFIDSVAAIIVEMPTASSFAVSPLTVSGSARVYEANVSLRLEDESGKVLAEDFATASEGAPGRGDFEKMLEFDVSEPTNAFLVAFEASANDGSETNVVRVPLRLCPPGSNVAC